MIGLVTYSKYPRLTDDDRPLMAELAQRGIRSEPVEWSDAAVRWGGFDALVLRSCWDYHLRPDEFRAWLDTIEREGVALWNPVSVVRWNMHKGYLRDLAAHGVLIPDTEWLRAGDDITLTAVLDMFGWTQAIVKPAISASATDTWRTSDNLAADDARLAEQLRRSDVLVQALIPEVARDGEWSLMFIDGEFSHAMLKRPASGDFRVQLEHGGSAVPAQAPQECVVAGAEVLKHVPGRTLFARIDGVLTARGFMLMEAEVIEPVLFFANAPHARGRLADALCREARG
jgi:glutathione synthase/RimK-type ligase-like ATP-grasp enzyme